MKSFQSILFNLSKKKCFKHLKTINIINKLILTLPCSLRKSVIFTSIKNDTLFIAMNHPAYTSEFNNFKANILLSIIEQLKENYQNKDELDEIKNIKKIKAYVPKDVLNNFVIHSKNDEIDFTIKIIPIYKERSSGEFIVESSNPFKKEFENIKKIIKNANSSR